MRRGKSIVSALLAAVLAAIALVACGGDEDSSTTAATPTETTAPQQEPGVTPDGSEDEEKAGGSKSAGNDSNSPDADEGGTSSGSGGDSGSSGSTSKGSPNSVAKGKTGPVRVSGGGSAALVTKGGDNSIQEFGDEADDGELEAAAIVAHGYLVGRATGDWPAACGYVSKGMQEQLDQLASGSAQLKGKGCPAVMAALTSGVPGNALAALTEVDALSLRNDGERGFLIYRSGDGTNYFMPMTQEDGAWKVTALASTPLS